jgi:hypothetical protein
MLNLSCPRVVKGSAPEEYLHVSSSLCAKAAMPGHLQTALDRRAQNAPSLYNIKYAPDGVDSLPHSVLSVS